VLLFQNATFGMCGARRPGPDVKDADELRTELAMSHNFNGTSFVRTILKGYRGSLQQKRNLQHCRLVVASYLVGRLLFATQQMDDSRCRRVGFFCVCIQKRILNPLVQYFTYVHRLFRVLKALGHCVLNLIGLTVTVLHAGHKMRATGQAGTSNNY
jgi:hypothetical protein